jgi:hypothetical protein
MAQQSQRFYEKVMTTPRHTYQVEADVRLTSGKLLFTQNLLDLDDLTEKFGFSKFQI